MNKFTNELKSTQELLHNLPTLKKLLHHCHDITAADPLVKEAFALVYPGMDLPFKVINVGPATITLGAENSVVYSRLHYTSAALEQRLGKKIICQIIHYDGKTIIDPKKLE